MAIVRPFDFNPVDNKETTSSYTVPAGKYAIVTVTLNVRADGTTVAVNDPSGTAISEVSDSNATSLELRLLTGSVLTKTETAASGTATSATANVVVQAYGISTAIALVDGVAVSKISCGATATIGANTAGTRTATVSGEANVNWHISEYNNLV